MNDAQWAREYEARYLFASYLYNHEADGIQSPIADSEFDNIVTVLEAWYDKTSPEFRCAIPRGGLKTHNHAIALSEVQIIAAKDWAARRAKNSLAMAQL
jgi:hypothetical protein